MLSSLATFWLFLLLTGSITSFLAALDSLKSHRAKEQLKKLFPLFFYLGVHNYCIGRELQGVRLCLRVTRLFAFLASATSFFLALQESGFFENSSPLFEASLLFALLFSFFLLSDLLPRFAAHRWPLYSLRVTSISSSLLCTLLLCINYPLLQLLRYLKSKEGAEIDPSLEIKERLRELLYELELETSQKGFSGEAHNKKLLQGLLKYQDRVVREIMVPRTEIFSLNSQTSLHSAAEQILKEGYTRVPVYGENMDQLIGLIMAKDLLKTYLQAQKPEGKPIEENQTIASLVKPVLFTPEHRSVSALLQDFRKKKLHLAIVVDEYGATEGLVTIEDILEEIVGEIEDEYDLKKNPYTLLSDGSYLVDAHMSIFDLQENLGILLPSQEGYDTLSGYIFSKIGSIPAQGLLIHQNDFDLEIIASNERSVERVRVRPHLDYRQSLPYKESSL